MKTPLFSALASPVLAVTGPMAVSKTFRQKSIPGRGTISTGLAVLCFLAIPANGSVTILWEEYHCSGETYWGIPETGYSYTDSTPVSASKIDDWGGAWSSAWMFGAMAGTGASREWASSSSTFVFTVAKPTLIIEILGNLYSTAFPDTHGGISYLLTDNLTNSIIGSRSWSLTYDDMYPDGYGWVRSIEDSATYHLVAGNEYKLFISANVTNADGTDAYIEAILIPESSPLVLLTIGGIGGLVLRRRI